MEGVSQSRSILVWPGYAYEATFLVHYMIEYHAATVQQYLISNTSSYGALSTPSTLVFYSSAASQAFHYFFAIIKVPGQKLLPYDASLTRPKTTIENALIGSITQDSWSLTITQINSSQPLSSVF